MKLGIDASNIRAGGGVTHLRELLRVEHPHDYGVDQIIVWGGSSTLDRLEERPWLCKVYEPLLDRGLPMRLYWQRFILDRLARREECDLLFIPGGSYFGSFRPFVTMSQNLIPFQWREVKRYGISWMFLRNLLLFWSQKQTFQNADGVIFLTNYAQNMVLKKVHLLPDRIRIISHGVDDKFRASPRKQKSLQNCSLDRPFRVLYVSSVDLYKHQWHVAEAVAKLNTAGYPLRLDFIGAAYPPALKRLRTKINQVDQQGEFIFYQGKMDHKDLLNYYAQADLFVYASSCETFGQIVIEAMAAGLPIACSNQGPMCEILGGAGLYFDPENSAEIAQVLKVLIDSPTIRADKAKIGQDLVEAYNWAHCIHETFNFFSKIANRISD